jgi:hypothetical protein
MEINIRLSALYMLTLMYVFDWRLPEPMATELLKKVIGNILINSWHSGKTVSCFTDTVAHNYGKLVVTDYSLHDITFKRPVILFALPWNFQY